MEFKPFYLIYTIITFGIGVFLVVLENNIQNASSLSQYSFLFLVLSGFLMSAGVIIPGVSSTLILMLLGIYDVYLESVACLYLPFLLPLCIGLFIGCFVFMKITQFLLNKYYAVMFFSIIGFTLGSIFVLFPGFTFDFTGIISIFSLLLGLFLANTMTDTQN